MAHIFVDVLFMSCSRIEQSICVRLAQNSRKVTNFQI